tara:strand:- start:1321 stop:1563 length:243 start_codon:yes stop_codon:yes gene_type:complete
MKSVKNTSLQGITIPFKTPEGLKSLFLAPKSSAAVPDSWDSKVLRNLVERRMAKVVYVADPPAAPAPVLTQRNTRRKEVS